MTITVPLSKHSTQMISFPGIDLPPEFTLPAYHGRSILNIPSSISRLFGIPPIHSSALDDEILSPSDGGIKRVIFILVDALAVHRFNNWFLDGELLLWRNLLKSGSVSEITSIAPSTTCAALTTLWTGHSTAEHGVAGYELWLKQYGLVANMITHAPMSYRNGDAALEKAGFNAETVLQVPKLGEYLEQHGVTTCAFQPYTIANSGLSKTFMHGAEIHPFGTEAECWVNMRKLIEERREDKLLLWTYRGQYDHLSHVYGPDDERSELFLRNFSDSLEYDLINRLSPELKKGTLLILTADHGQINVPKNPDFHLVNHPEFLNCLHINPTGEGRLTYLHLKPGKESTVRDYVEATWPGQFILHKSADLLNSGFFGPGEPMMDIHNRLGDFTMIAKGTSYLWWADEEMPLSGRHGGLTAEEMLVPFFAVRL